MAILSPFGRVCMTSNPILKSHFTVAFQSPIGKFEENDSIEVMSIPSLGFGVRIQDWVGYNAVLPMPGFREKVQDVQMQFRMFDDTEGWKFWKSWTESLYLYTGGADDFQSAGYAGRGTVTLLKSEGKTMSEHIVITMKNVWPSQFRLDSLEMTSEGDPVTYTVTLQMESISFDKKT